MDRQKLLNKFPNDKILFSKVLDKLLVTEKTFDKCFTFFIDPNNLSLIIKILENEVSDIKLLTYGGTSEAERKILGFFPENIEPTFSEFPIDCLCFNYNSKFRNLSHKDFLGSILGLGIDRSKVGDIFVLDEKAIAFVYSDISGFIISNLEKVSNSKVTVSLVENADNIFNIYQKTGSLISINVSSLRLDSIISAAFHLSRGKAVDLISGEKAFVNWVLSTSASHQIKESDTITLRGYGRIIVNELSGKTKKDRYVLLVEVYK